MTEVSPVWKNAGVVAADDWPEARESRLYFDRAVCQARMWGCRGAADSVHHRRPSDRRTGDHAFARLISLCFVCHGAIHAHPGWAVRYGWLLRSGTEGPVHHGCEIGCEQDHRRV